MAPRVHFSLILHNHQPIGNFDHVFEQAYQDSYLPFLEVFEPYEHLRIALHTSGPLCQWLDRHHPDYLDRIRQLVQYGRLEIIGGAFYEPILAMIPSRDRIGQIERFRTWLSRRLGGEIRGMWVPERVWEQSMARDLADAGVYYTLLDDYHFKNAGLTEEQLDGYYLTEDDGRVLRVIPGSEPLRYMIPFQSPEETIAYLGRISERHPGAFVAFGDDGEKFGSWPDTKQHVYQNGWLRHFFDLLTANKDWLDTTTPSQAMQQVDALGKIYLPEGSYREMTEWAMPVDRQIESHEVQHMLEESSQWHRVSAFVRGGFWRNFKTRYPESNEMYARMMQVSGQLASLEKAGTDETIQSLLESARDELYQAQCNCSYWHGAFGGIYLPHLRNAVFQHLIRADGFLEQASGRNRARWCQASQSDLNFDGRDEIQLSSDQLNLLLEPGCGGRLYELDVRSIAHNLLATLSRRPEAYHQKVLAGPSGDGDHMASIHDRVVFKQEGLDQLLQYDDYGRKSLIDHFFDREATLDTVRDGSAQEKGDFILSPYDAEIQPNESATATQVQATLRRTGFVEGVPISVSKKVTLGEGESAIVVEYFLEQLPPDQVFHFAVEWNFAGMPAGADDRLFYGADQQPLGQLGSQLDLREVTGIGLVDRWLGIDVGLTCNRPTNFWTFPIATVSQSEGGFEAVHQSVVVMPHWLIQGDSQGQWGVTMRLSMQSTAEHTPATEGATATLIR
ncbi:MAG: DUF1926 domain-containing protein [Pirellulales bacterium]|nr:DUF1926 domain-containing protein [Pirellulales bacterium]